MNNTSRYSFIEESNFEEQNQDYIPDLLARIRHLEKLLSIFANPNNWTTDLRWCGKGSPISIAEDKVKLLEA